MFYNENHLKKQRCFVRRATKCAEKISKRLDKIVLLSSHHKCEAYAEDVKKNPTSIPAYRHHVNVLSPLTTTLLAHSH